MYNLAIVRIVVPVLIFILILVAGICWQVKTYRRHKRLFRQKAIAEVDSTITESMPGYDIQIYDDFLSNEEIAAMKGATIGNMTASHVYTDSSDVYNTSTRDSEQCWLTDINPTIKALRLRFEQLVKLPRKDYFYEDVQVVRYKKGGFFTPHYDGCQGTAAFCHRMNNPHGPRYVTILCYLNTVSEGGETVFPNIDKSVQAVKGRCVVFYNTHKNGKLITEALHGGNSVLKGEKWICNQWIRIGN
jgi:prolyl 4-hydroxylase